MRHRISRTIYLDNSSFGIDEPRHLGTIRKPHLHFGLHIRELIAWRSKLDHEVGTDRSKAGLLSFCEASHRLSNIHEASALRIEPSRRVKPPLESKATPRSSDSAHSSRMRPTRMFILLVLLLAGDITRISPLGSRSICVASFAAQKRSNSSSLIGVSGRKRNGSCSSETVRLIMSIFASSGLIVVQAQTV